MSRRGTAEKRTAKSDPIFRNRLVNMVVIPLFFFLLAFVWQAAVSFR